MPNPTNPTHSTKAIETVVNRNLPDNPFRKYWDRVGDKYGKGILIRELNELFSSELSQARKEAIQQEREKCIEELKELLPENGANTAILSNKTVKNNDLGLAYKNGIEISIAKLKGEK
jgi:hypothetical protein